MLLAQAIDDFILFKQAENLSDKTVLWYQHHLAVFQSHMPSDQLVATIQPRDIATYIAAQTKRQPPLAPYTIRARYATVRAFLNWCEAEPDTGLTHSPLGHGQRKRIKPPRTGTPATKYVPYHHYQQFTASIPTVTWKDARDRLLAIVLFWTGVRLQECVDLRVDDFDTNRGLLTIRQGKGRKARTIPIDTDTIRPALLQYLYMRPTWHDSHLWLGESADSQRILKPLQGEGIRQTLIRRCRRAHIPYYNPHAWRHAFGMWLINSGASMAAVSLVMGHSSVQVTEKVYAHMQTPAIQREFAAAVAYIKQRGDRPLLW